MAGLQTEMAVLVLTLWFPAGELYEPSVGFIRKSLLSVKQNTCINIAESTTNILRPRGLDIAYSLQRSRYNIIIC